MAIGGRPINRIIFDRLAGWLRHAYAGTLFGARARRLAPAGGILVLAAVLAACASPAVVATPAPTATPEAATAAPPATPTAPATPEAASGRPFVVEHVGVEVGVGSPGAADVVVSGTWPDLCAQLAETRQTVAEGRIEITLLATAADPACPPDYLGLPFRFAVPLNVTELPVGSYTIVVNGASTTFDWQAGNTPPTIPIFEPALVDSVTLEIDGSQAVKTMRAIVSGSLANVCAQVREVHVQRDGNSFFIVVLADNPAGEGCVRDPVPFELTVPLSLAHLPAGVYEVNANDVKAQIDTTAN